MRNKLFTLLFVFALSGSAASIVGTSVTGTLTFTGDPSNYFDPLNGFVPSTGYLNTSNPTVTISNSAVEFGYDDGANRISANFTGNQLAITDLVELTGPLNAWQVTFTDNAFATDHLILGAGTLPVESYSLIGDVITLNFAGGNVTAGQDLTANVALAAPEPASLGLAGVAILLAAGLLINYRRREPKEF